MFGQVKFERLSHCLDLPVHAWLRLSSSPLDVCCLWSESDTARPGILIREREKERPYKQYGALMWRWWVFYIRQEIDDLPSLTQRVYRLLKLIFRCYLFGNKTDWLILNNFMKKINFDVYVPSLKHSSGVFIFYIKVRLLKQHMFKDGLPVEVSLK